MLLCPVPGPKIPVSKLTSYSRKASKEDVKRLQKYWRRLHKSRKRDAIYGFLAELFELVSWWKVQEKDHERAIRLFDRFCEPNTPLHREPFAVTLAIAASPDKIDRRTLSKFSRVLRFASECKSYDELFVDFVKRKGGLNACAALYTLRLRRLQKKRNKSV